MNDNKVEYTKTLSKWSKTLKAYKSFNVVSAANVAGNSPVKLFEVRSLYK